MVSMASADFVKLQLSYYFYYWSSNNNSTKYFQETNNVLSYWSNEDNLSQKKC